MVTFEQAREKAQEKLLELARQVPALEIVIHDEGIRERARGWMFPYNTRRFFETRHPSDGLVGNGPIFVDRESGNVYVLPSGGYRSWLDEYDRTGVAPAVKGGMRWIGKGPAPPFPSPRSRKPGAG